MLPSIQIFNEARNEKRNNALYFYVSAYRKKVRQILKANIQRERETKRERKREGEREKERETGFEVTNSSHLAYRSPESGPFFFCSRLVLPRPVLSKRDGDLNHYYDVSS